jgi:O-antigen/teichoic acid export membrane protein
LTSYKKDTEQSPLNAPTESSEAGPNKASASPISLKRLAIKGSVWVMFGFGMAQVLRLGGNVILTRLLTPEAFGIMAIVGALLMGLQMFSDIGLRTSIIQSPRGEEPAFIRTAWSLQVIRGFILASLAAILAWPLAFINGEPSLVLITMVAGLTAIISGFHSTWLLVYSRRMVLNKLVLLDLIGQFLSIVVMVVWAHYFPSVWVLVLGSFVGSTVKLVASHTLLSGVSMRFQWEIEAVHELIRFGRWIFISTALSFLVIRLDIFVFGSFAGLTMLGIFVLAKNLSRLIVEALMKLSSTVLLPVYSRLAERSTNALRTRTFKIRAALLALFLPPLWVIILWVPHIIEILYDVRYKDAGWMLQILAAGAIATAIRATIGPVLLAVGNSFRHMIGTAIVLGLQIVSMTVGAILAGVPGFIVGMALTDWLYYPVLAYLIRPYGVWLPFLDAVAFGSSVIVIGLVWWIN